MNIPKKQLVLALLLPIQIALVHIAKQFPSTIEHYYSQGIYPFISKLLRVFFGWIPFSVGDVCIAILLYIVVHFVYRLLQSRFKHIKSMLVRFLAFISTLYFCFYFFWGLNYYREPLSKNLNFTSLKYSTHELVMVTQKMIENTNRLQFKLTGSDSLVVNTPYSSSEIYEKAIDGFTQIGKQYPQLLYTKKSIKSSLMSLLQSYNGTSGYFNPLTGEAHINDCIPKTGYPTTTCHEMAHQLGWAAENEANFVGFLAATSNDDVYFQYAGYRMATRYLIFELYKRDQVLFKELYNSIHKGVLKDYKASSDFWKQYENSLEPIVKKGYNAYLKANKQVNGIESYNYVVDLIIQYYYQHENDFSIF